MTGGSDRFGRGQSGLIIMIPGILLVVLRLVFIPTASALPSTPEDRLGLADYFFSEAAYDEAIVEYKTFRYFYPDHPRFDYAGFRIALSYFKQSRYDRSLEGFQQVAVEADGRHPVQAIEARFMVSRSYVALGRKGPAVVTLQQMLTTIEDTQIRDRAYYLLGWIRLETVREIDADTIADAAGFFSKISPDKHEAYRLDEMHKWLEWARSGEGGLLKSRKSPVLAGSLAVFPGAGYLYSGRFQDALVTLLFNGGMLWAVYESFDNDLPVLGTMISFVGGGFYAGSIYGSISAAHKHNHRLSRLFIENLGGIKIGVLPVKQGQGVMTGVTVPF